MLCERHRTRQKDVSSCSFWIFYHNNALPDKKWEKLEDKGLQGREKEEILWKGVLSFHHCITGEEHRAWMIADGEKIAGFFPGNLSPF